MERHQYLDCSAVRKHSGVRRTKDHSANNLKDNDNASAPSGINEGRSDLEFTSNPTDATSKVTNDSGDTIVSSTDIVQMDNNAKVEHSMLEAHTTTMQKLIPTMTSDLDHSIKTFLARPFLLGTYTVTTSTTVNSLITQVNLFSTLMSLPYYSNKLIGVVGLRANTHIRVQTNANRFQQGRLLINYFPGYANSSKQATINDSLMARTQLPRVESDINTTDECTLSVPFLSDRPFYDFQNAYSSTGGHVGIVMYSPLLSGSGGETEFQLSVWVHLTDVELFWPGTVNPQSGLVTTNLRRKSGRSNPESEVPPAHRPISGFLSRVSTSSSILSKIPLLSSIATPVSWSTRILSDAAAAMGWSKPNSCMKERYSIIQTAGWANSSGVNLGENLGALEDNKVSILEDMGGTQVDQMSLKYPLSIPTFFKSFSVSTTTTSGSVISTGTVHPWQFYTATSTGNGNHYTPLGYFSKLFAFWRGTIRIRIKAIKTEFHTARFRFIVSPNDINAIDTMAYYISEIMDIRDASEWTFDVPYMASTPYLPTRESVPDHPRTYARYGIVLINELRCPETVAQSVNFIMEVSAGEDFEFAAPQIPRNLLPKASPIAFTGIPNIGVSSNDSNIFQAVGGGLYAQGPEDIDAQYVSGHYPIANVPIHEPTLEPSKLCIGERITSLKQLAMRPSFVGSTTRKTFYFFVDNPNVIYITGTATASTCANRATYYDFVRLCYGFYRGGVSVKITGAQNAVVSMANSDYPYNAYGSVASPVIAVPTSIIPYTADPAGNAVYVGSIPSMVHYSTPNQGVLDVVVPHYSLRPVRRNQLLIDQDGVSPGDTIYFNMDGRIVMYGETDGTSNQVLATGARKNIFLAASDDFQCNFFTGCPILRGPTLLSNIANASNVSNVTNVMFN